MKQAPDIANAAHMPSPQKGEVLANGWRVKGRKTTPQTESPGKPVQAEVHAEVGAELGVTKSKGDQSPLPRRWNRWLGVFASTGAAIIVLITVMNILPSWFNSPSVSHPAHAETQALLTPISSKATAVTQISSDEVYQLNLGAYQSELGARLMWAGLEANSDLLYVLDPLFEPEETVQGMVYHVLAGTFASEDDADVVCSWLREHDVDCSIVRSL